MFRKGKSMNDKKNMIIAVAEQMYAHFGFKKTTMEEIAKKAKSLLSNREILKIDIREAVKFTHRNTNKNKNDEKFVKWLIWLLDKYNSNDATVVYANEEINNYLNKYLTPITWLNYSPTTNSELESNEIMVDLNEIK